MANISFYFKLSRLLNLLIVGLTMYFFRYIILAKYIQLNFSHVDFAIFVFTTMLVTAGGYVINNIYDLSIDKINKGDQLIINNPPKEKKANIFYISLVLIGIIPTLYLATKYQHLDYALLYPLSIIILWFYAKIFKRYFLIGNIIVSVLSSGVAMLVYLSENETISTSENTIVINNVFIFYSVFAFLSTLAREITKDIEDIDGDRKNNCKSLPIILGIRITKSIIIALNILLILIIGYFLPSYFLQLSLGVYFAYILLILPLLLFTILLVKKATNFKKLSLYYKLLMVCGITFLLFL